MHYSSDYYEGLRQSIEIVYFSILGLQQLRTNVDLVGYWWIPDRLTTV